MNSCKFYFLIYLLPLTSQATDLLTAYQQAQQSDPLYQQAIAEQLSAAEGVPISTAALWPTINFAANPTLTHSSDHRDHSIQSTQTEVAYTATLQLTQPIVDFAKFYAIDSAKSTAREARAKLNAALQNLVVRVANAYFTVLKDQETLLYRQATKKADAEQLKQIKQQYRVGLKTKTDIDTATATFDTDVAEVIAAKTTLENDHEDLRALTGQYDRHLATLQKTIPLTTPEPANIDRWVATAIKQNWTIKANQYHALAKQAVIKENFAGHLPILTLQGNYGKQYHDTISTPGIMNIPNSHHVSMDEQIGLIFTIPLFSGGAVTAKTKQACFDYQAALQQLQYAMRTVIKETRQNYLGMVSSITKIKADKQAITSAINSLHGIEASYRAGSETLLNVLSQQKQLLYAQTQYVADRYAYINYLLGLKQAAGILDFTTLQAINSWLQG